MFFWYIIVFKISKLSLESLKVIHVCMHQVLYTENYAFFILLVSKSKCLTKSWLITFCVKGVQVAWVNRNISTTLYYHTLYGSGDPLLQISLHVYNTCVYGMCTLCPQNVSLHTPLCYTAQVCLDVLIWNKINDISNNGFFFNQSTKHNDISA